MKWSDQAACKGWPTELFYVDRHQRLHPEIQALCGACPVQAECLEWALQHEHFGYWGGKSERQRRGMRKSLGVRFILPSEMSGVRRPF